MPPSLVRRYLVFLLVITLAVVGGEQLYQLLFLNTAGRAEVEHALSLHPDLDGRLGEHHLGFAWRGSRVWWTVGETRAIIYMPVRGERVSGVVYLRELDESGVWKLQRMAFRETGAADWKLYQ